MPRRWSIRFVGLFALLEGSQLAHAQQQYQFNQGDLVEVGNHRSEFWSEGGCDNDKEMRVAAANDVYVPSQRSTMAPMLTPTTKIYWYCNGERRTINRERPFTWFKADRAGDGTIQWTFYSGRSG